MFCLMSEVFQQYGPSVTSGVKTHVVVARRQCVNDSSVPIERCHSLDIQIAFKILTS